MKKAYKKPRVEIEVYTLDTSIASNCGIVVSNGPALGDHAPCEGYEDPFGTFSARSGPYNVHFYEDTNCDCYTTTTEAGYWTS